MTDIGPAAIIAAHDRHAAAHAHHHAHRRDQAAAAFRAAEQARRAEDAEHDLTTYEQDR